MQIILYNNKSENNRVDKDITNPVVLEGEMRDQLNLINPTIMVTSKTLINSNYCFIKDLGRYYFIVDITAFRKDVYILNLKCDVLMTYSDSIKEQTAVIARQQNKNNYYLTDDTFKVYNYPQIVVKEFKQGFLNEANFILMVAGCE